MTHLIRQTVTLGPDICHPERLTLQVDVVQATAGEPADDSDDPAALLYPVEIPVSPWGPLRARVRVLHAGGDV